MEKKKKLLYPLIALLTTVMLFSGTVCASSASGPARGQVQLALSGTVTTISTDTIISIQEKLNLLGYDCGIADGIAGQMTNAAISRFKEDYGLGSDSEIDKELIDALNHAKLTASSLESFENGSSSGAMHLISLSQGNAAFMISGDHAMLIDAGSVEDGALVVDYLQSRGVTKLEYLIGTRLDEKSIGGFQEILNHFDVENIILPSTGGGAESDSQVLSEIRSAIDAKGISVSSPSFDTSYRLGDIPFSLLSSDGVNLLINVSSDIQGSSSPEAGKSAPDQEPIQLMTETEATPSPADSDIIVHITKTGEKYHSAGCQYLRKSDIPISLSSAKSMGYTPCSKCSPPR